MRMLRYMSSDPADAKYKLTFRISSLEQWQMSSFYGRLCMFVHGETVCRIKVKGHSGNEDYVPEDRLSKCFKSLAKRLIKFKK